MNYLQKIVVFILISVVYSCGTSKHIEYLESEARLAYTNNNFQKALDYWEELIDFQKGKNKEIDGNIYQNAGLVAWELNETGKAIDYLEKAKQTPAANGKTYYTLAKAYLKIDNLSREIINLNAYLDNFERGEEVDEVRRQLFIAYVESTNWESAGKLWNELKPQHQSDIIVLSGYLRVKQNIGNEDEINPLAKQLLEIDKDNVDALEVLAVSYYRTAEDRYQVEMNAYEQNRTTRQYRKLLTALEEINANFRTSRDYFEQLYKLKPDTKYATFLGNIYTRFDNKQKADYYYRKAKE